MGVIYSSHPQVGGEGDGGNECQETEEITLTYQEFLKKKSQEHEGSGIKTLWMPSSMFKFQESLTEWAIWKGRGAIFADCGLGKTLMQLVWAENIHRATNKNILILTPLAVAYQTVREGEKFGIQGQVSREGMAYKGITITNYERLHYFNPQDFIGVVCDESSILKSFDGTTRQAITQFMLKMPYRLLATATAAPNDYIELGTSSEALGYLGHMDMLARFFKNEQNNCAAKRFYGEAPAWRLKGHAEIPFWKWVCSWARACRKPSDLGFSDDQFKLPSLDELRHMVDTDKKPEGMLFNLPASNLFEQREERKRTLQERCEMAAQLASHERPALVWCHLNDEGDVLEKIIPGCIQISGKDSDKAKEEKFTAFTMGEARCLVTKPKIGAWGLNWQHCADIVYFPSHSYESYYQAVRRCWRFGQKQNVTVNLVMTEGEIKVMDNLQRKSEQASEMFSRLVEEMNHAVSIERTNEFTKHQEVPAWL